MIKSPAHDRWGGYRASYRLRQTPERLRWEAEIDARLGPLVAAPIVETLKEAGLG